MSDPGEDRGDLRSKSREKDTVAKGQMSELLQTITVQFSDSNRDTNSSLELLKTLANFCSCAEELFFRGDGVVSEELSFSREELVVSEGATRSVSADV